MIIKSDITQSKECDNLFRLLTGSRDYAIAMLDSLGNIVHLNPGAEHMLGFSLDELKGKHISDCYAGTGKRPALVHKQLNDAIIKGRIEIECQLIKKDRGVLFAEIIYTPLYEPSDELSGIAAMIRDISRERKLAEENKALHDKLEERVRQRTQELEKVNKELNAFSYSVSHDLRTPLRAISGFSKMLLEDYNDNLDEEGSSILNTIIENAEMMGKLIDDLLAFSRFSRLEVLEEMIDVKSIAQKSINDLLLVWQRNYSITITDLPTCQADPAMMKQVWMNLIENALKYSSKEERPSIKIGFTEADDAVTYFICDNGVGFDMRYSSKLFGVFQRLHTDDEFPGTGLGLALANRIVAKHGGRIWAESELGKGATFYFTIPKLTSKSVKNISP